MSGWVNWLMQPPLGLACARILKTPAPILFLHVCVCACAHFLGSAGDGVWLLARLNGAVGPGRASPC